MDKGLLEQLPYYLSPAAAVLVAILAYVFGRRQTEHERLYTRRAEVVAELFKRYEDLGGLWPFRLHSKPPRLAFP